MTHSLFRIGAGLTCVAVLAVAGCRNEPVPQPPGPPTRAPGEPVDPAPGATGPAVDDSVLLATATTVPPPTTQPAQASQTQWTAFGDPMTDEAVDADLAEVLANPAAFEGKTLNLTGTVSEVCQPKGCWLRLKPAADAEQEVLVKFTCPIDGRLIPLEAAGRPAKVQGQVVVEEMSEADARHIAEDAGKSPEEIEQIVGPQRVIRVMSPSAKVQA